jgi:hypothetical protein
MMPPWDEAAYFRVPVETNVTVAVGPTPVPLCLASPQRVAMYFSNSGTGNCWISTIPTIATQTGTPLLSSTLPLHLLFSEVGPLVQMQWFAIASGAVCNVNVIEVFLDRWPDEPAIQGAVSGEPLSVTLRRLIRSLDRLVLRGAK